MQARLLVLDNRTIKPVLSFAVGKGAMTDFNISEDVITAEDAAPDAGVTKRTVIYAIQRGDLVARKVSDKLTSSYLIRKDEKYADFVKAQLERVNSVKPAKNTAKNAKKEIKKRAQASQT